MNIQSISVAKALESLRSGALGLSSGEAQRRMENYGPNHVEQLRGRSPIVRLLAEFTHLFALILWVAAGLAFFAQWSSPGHGMARLGWVIIAVIIVSGLFSFWQEHRAERTLAALHRLLPSVTKVFRDETLSLLAAEQLVPGDVIVLEQGDRVPADCRLVETFGVRIDDAAITGESVPRFRDAAATQEGDLIHCKNIVLAGTWVVSGQAKALVFATGMQTRFGAIARLTQIRGDAVSPLRKEIAHLSRVVGIVAVMIGILFLTAAWAIGTPFWEAFILAIGIIVAMVPEGLLPTLTLALVLATQRMAKRQVLIRHLPSVETLGSTTVICTDKTGTLTEGRMRVTQLLVGLKHHMANADEWTDALGKQYGHLLLGALLCHDIRETEQHGKITRLGDPMEIALVEWARPLLPNFKPSSRLDEIPFDDQRMMLATVHQTPDGPVLHSKGALKTLLPLCRFMVMDGEIRPLTPELRNYVIAAESEMAEQGLRVLAFAYRDLESQWAHDGLEQDLIFVGVAGLEDPPRPEVSHAVGRCAEAGIKIIMVTGDHPRTALAIARKIGLVRSDKVGVLSGDQLDGLSDSQLDLVLETSEIIFARVSAEHKLRIVDTLKAKRHIVAVTGDGVNDAPALKSAQIGIAMGLAGTDVAKESADMILLDDNFASIVNGIEEGRAVFENIQRFLTYILTHNVPELIPYLAFSLFAIPLALTPLQILAVDMGTDSLTALGLGTEQPDQRVMQRPPRSQRQHLFDWPLALRAYLFLGIIEATAAMAAFFFVLHRGGWHYGERLGSNEALYAHATTACLSAIIVMQIVNVFLCRSTGRSVFVTGLLGNPLILWGVGLEIILILAIDYSPWGNLIFGTAPISHGIWLFMLPFAMGLLILEELRKHLVRRFRTHAWATRDS